MAALEEIEVVDMDIVTDDDEAEKAERDRMIHESVVHAVNELLPPASASASASAPASTSTGNPRPKPDYWRWRHYSPPAQSQNQRPPAASSSTTTTIVKVTPTTAAPATPAAAQPALTVDTRPGSGTSTRTQTEHNPIPLRPRPRSDCAPGSPVLAPTATPSTLHVPMSPASPGTSPSPSFASRSASFMQPLPTPTSPVQPTLNPVRLVPANSAAAPAAGPSTSMGPSASRDASTSSTPVVVASNTAAPPPAVVSPTLNVERPSTAAGSNADNPIIFNEPPSPPAQTVLQVSQLASVATPPVTPPIQHPPTYPAAAEQLSAHQHQHHINQHRQLVQQNQQHHAQQQQHLARQQQQQVAMQQHAHWQAQQPSHPVRPIPQGPQPQQLPARTHRIILRDNTEVTVTFAMYEMVRGLSHAEREQILASPDRFVPWHNTVIQMWQAVSRSAPQAASAPATVNGASTVHASTTVNAATTVHVPAPASATSTIQAAVGNASNTPPSNHVNPMAQHIEAWKAHLRSDLVTAIKQVMGTSLDGNNLISQAVHASMRDIINGTVTTAFSESGVAQAIFFVARAGVRQLEQQVDNLGEQVKTLTEGDAKQVVEINILNGKLSEAQRAKAEAEKQSAAQLAALVSTCSKQREHLEDKDATIKSLQINIKSLQTAALVDQQLAAEARNASEKEIAAVTAECDAAKADLATCRAELERCEKDLVIARDPAPWDAMIAEVHKQANERIKKNNQKMSEELAKTACLEKELEEMSAAKAQLETELTDKAAELKRGTRAANSANKKLEVCAQELKAATAELDATKAELESTKKKVVDAESQASTSALALQVVRTDLQTVQDELKMTKSKLEASDAKVQTAEDHLGTARTELRLSEHNRKTTEDKLKATEGKLKTAEKQRKNTEELLKTTADTLKTTEGKLKTVEGTSKAAEGKLKTSETKLRDTEVQLFATRVQLQTAQNNLKSSTSNSKASQSKLKAAEEKLKAAEEKLKAAEDQLIAADEESEAVKKRLHETEGDLEKAKAQTKRAEDGLKESMKKLQIAEETIGTGERELKKVMARLQTAEDEVKTITNALAAANAARDQALVEAEGLTDVVEPLVEQVIPHLFTALRVNMPRGPKTMLEETNLRSERLCQEVARLVSDHARLEATNNELNAKLDALTLSAETTSQAAANVTGGRTPTPTANGATTKRRRVSTPVAAASGAGNKRRRASSPAHIKSEPEVPAPATVATSDTVAAGAQLAADPELRKFVRGIWRRTICGSANQAICKACEHDRLPARLQGSNVDGVVNHMLQKHATAMAALREKMRRDRQEKRGPVV